jgi:TolB protein
VAVSRHAFRSTARLVVVLVTVSVLVSALLVGVARSARQASPLIAFTRADGVFVMRSDGSGVRLLRRTGLWTPWVTWSPDGRKIAFVVNSATGGLWVMNADGTDPLHLAETSWVSRPTWSPDGRRIAFAGTRDGRSGIWIVNADGSDLRRLTLPRLDRLGASGVDWSPTGGRFAVATPSWLVGDDIYVMNANGSNLRNLMPGRAFGASGEPDWSPDGRMIVFTHAVPQPPALQSEEWRNAEIWVMDAGGASRVRLTDNHVPDYDPVWSPDGSKIAFVGAYAGPNSSEIYLIDSDGTGFTRLTHNRVSESSPSWQPVGR